MNCTHFLRPVVTGLVSLALAVCPVFGQDAGKKYQPRVMSYNLHHLEGQDGKIDYRRVADVINRVNPDVVAVQEVDSMTKRTGGVDQLARLAAEALYHPTFAAGIPLQGGKYGVGILSKERPKAVRRVPLPGSEARVLLMCDFGEYVFACTHLDLTEKARMESLPIILKEARSWGKPFIIAGDWNAEPEEAFIKQMQEHFVLNSGTRNKTYETGKPSICIDYIATLKDHAAVTLSSRVVDEPVASDHYPIVCDLRLKRPAQSLMQTKPYLQDPRPNSMTVMFQTTVPANCWVEYGTDSLHTQRVRTLVDGQQVCHDIENKIVLDNLQPGTKYFYRVVAVDMLKKYAYEFRMGDTLRTRYYSFTTPSATQTDFTCLVFNDLHDQSGVIDYLFDRVKDIPYDFVVFNGDCLPEPYHREHAMQMIHKLADRIGGAEKPIFFIRGNHEIRNFYSAGMHSLIGYPDDKTYGAFNWGDTRFMVLDCGEDKPDGNREYGGFNDFTSLRTVQQGFIRTELKSKAFKKAQRRVLICHIPVFNNDDKYTPCTDLWGDLLKDQPFDLAMFAHKHQFDFFKQGICGAKFPVYYGGGPNLKTATVAVLQKQGKQLKLKVLSQNPAQTIEAEL